MLQSKKKNSVVQISMFLLHILQSPPIALMNLEEFENLHLMATKHVGRVKVSEYNVGFELSFCHLGLCDLGQVT